MYLMNKIKLVAFDLDGTIADTLSLCIKAFRMAVQPYISQTLSEDDIIKTFGLNEEGMIRKVIKNEYWKQALQDFYPIYMKLHRFMCPQPFQGIRELIIQLRQNNLIVALITGKGAKSCEITLQQLGMNSYFNRIITGNAERNIKHEALNELLNVYHLSPAEIVYVGDTVSDIIQCRMVNVVCLSAAWCVTNSIQEELGKCNPGKVFNSIEKISEYLLNISNEY